MTPEEAIKTIQVAVAEVEWNYPLDYSIAFKTAIEALEKQIPKKVVAIQRTAHDFEDGVCKHSHYPCEHLKPFNHEYKYTDYKCPVCGKLTKDGTPNCCWNCGQALDWSDNMASFYNLDIETAFDKIRSGIDDGTWYFGVPIRDFLAFLVNIEGCEVIGNVHDNPELLRGDANA